MSLTASCHCGATRFEVEAAPVSLTECNCSYCARLGVLWAYCAPDAFRLLTPQASDTLYAPSGMNRHYFCATCGCKTYSVTPNWTVEPFGSHTHVGINARLLEDFDIASVPIEKIDGRNEW